MFTTLQNKQKFLHYPYKIEHSCMFNDGSSDWMTKLDGQGAGSQKYTFSGWFKWGDLPGYEVLYASSLDGSNFATIYRTGSDGIGILEYFSAAYKIQLETTEVLRDYNNWYHIVVVMDTTEGTAGNRIKVWVNNHQCTLTGTFPAVQNGNYLLPDYHNRAIGRWRHLDSNYYDGQMAEVVMLADQVLTPDSFGQDIKGIWAPKALEVNFPGSTDIYMKFDDVSDLPDSLGYDSSGNNNTFLTSFSALNHYTDSPTNNYCKFNQLKNLLVTHSYSGCWTQTSNASSMTGHGSFGMKSGKWYWEGKIYGGTATVAMIGICGERNTRYNVYGWQQADGYFYYSNNGEIYNSDDGGSVYGNSYTTNDVIGVAFDADIGTLEFFKNDVSQGIYDITATGAGLDGSYYFPAISDGSGTAYVQVEWNFGQRNGGLWGTKPIGYKTLCAENLPEPIIRKPEKAMDVLLWTGDGITTQKIEGLEFQPDIAWIKKRSEAGSHVFCDSVRGANHMWEPDTSNIEDQFQSYGYVESFNPDGITVNEGTEANSRTNDLSETHVAWCLKKDPKYGIDIVTYPGTGSAQAIAHNLGAVPHLIIVKNRTTAANNNVYNWQLLSKDDPWTDVHFLDLNNDGVDSALPWNDTAPTSTHFTVGTQTGTNGSGDSMIAYLFTSIPNFSHVFRWYGNGNANGPFINLGFKPKFILWKNSSSANSWAIYDSARDIINPADHRVHPDLNNSELSDGYNIDLLSNGFKIRTDVGFINTLNNWYFGIAFAERPFKYSNAAI